MVGVHGRSWRGSRMGRGLMNIVLTGEILQVQKVQNFKSRNNKRKEKKFHRQEKSIELKGAVT